MIKFMDTVRCLFDKWMLEKMKYDELEANQNKNNCLVSNFYNKLIFFALFPKQVGEERGRFQYAVEIAHKAVVITLISL